MRTTLVALAASLLFVGAAHAQEPVPASPNAEARPFTASAIEKAPPALLPSFYQKDPRWSTLRVGSYAFGDIACYYLSIVYGLWEKKALDDPETAIRSFTRPGLTDERGRLRTYRLSDVLPVQPAGRYPIDRNFTQRVAEKLEGDHVVTLMLKKKGWGTHFVTAREVVGNDILIFDPGRREGYTTLRERYGTPRPGSKITVFKIIRNA